MQRVRAHCAGGGQMPQDAPMNVRHCAPALLLPLLLAACDSGGETAAPTSDAAPTPTPDAALDAGPTTPDAAPTPMSDHTARE